MQILWHGENKIEIKAKDAIIKTGEQIIVNNFTLPGSGEFEIAGVEVHSISAGVYRFRVEDITIAYLDSLNRTLNDDEIKLLNDVSIAILPVGGGKVLDPKKAQEVIKAIEPQIIIPIEADEFNEFCKLIGGCEPVTESYKITKAQLLTLEGQTTVVLGVS